MLLDACSGPSSSSLVDVAKEPQTAYGSIRGHEVCASVDAKATPVQHQGNKLVNWCENLALDGKRDAQPWKTHSGCCRIRRDVKQIVVGSGGMKSSVIHTVHKAECGVATTKAPIPTFGYSDRGKLT